MHPRQPVDGFTNEVRLDELDPDSAFQVRDVLNAGATIGAVRETATPGHYLVRSELHTFLSDVIKRELKRKPEETEKGLDLDRLEKRIREALMPHVLETSEAVLHHLHPIDEVHGFTSEIFLDEVDPQHLRPVRNLLTAGSEPARGAARDKRRPPRASSCTPTSIRRLPASARASWRWSRAHACPSRAAPCGMRPSPTAAAILAC